MRSQDRGCGQGYKISGWPARSRKTSEALANLDATASTLAKASRSDATRKAYDQGWTAFETFCHDHGLADPMAATADTVRLYMAKLASDDMAVSTIKLRLTAINRRFKSEGKPTPAAMGNSVEVIDADGRPQIQLLSDVLAGLKRSTDKTAPAKRGRRGKARALDAGDVTAMLRLINDDSTATAKGPATDRPGVWWVPTPVLIGRPGRWRRRSPRRRHGTAHRPILEDRSRSRGSRSKRRERSPD